MGKVEFSFREYGDGENPVVVSLTAGYTGKLADLDTPAQALLAAGHDVVVYDYGTEVFTEGDPALLPRLIDDISQDFSGKSKGHEKRRYCGLSLGAGIGFNQQRRDRDDSLPGLYAGGGTNAARLIARNPLLWRERRAFSRNGYGESDIWNVWEGLHESPHSAFVIALGGMDFIVRHREAIRRLRDWQCEGTPIRVKTLPRLGHTGTIGWFKENIPAMLSWADAMIES